MFSVHVFLPPSCVSQSFEQYVSAVAFVEPFLVGQPSGQVEVWGPHCQTGERVRLWGYYRE